MIFTDLNGDTAEPTWLADQATCCVCGKGCIVVLDGWACHPGCWRESTDRQRGPRSAVTDTPVPAPASVVPAPGVTPAPIARPVSNSVRQPQDESAGEGPSRPARTFSGPAAVVEHDCAWLGDGTRVPLPERVRHLGDLVECSARWGLGSSPDKGEPDPPQLWLTPGAMARLGFPADLPRSKDGPVDHEGLIEATGAAPAVREAVQAGWEINASGHQALGRWTRIRRAGTSGAAAATAWLVVTEALLERNLPATPEEIAQGVTLDAQTLARRLARYCDALKRPYRISSSTTGLALLKETRTGRDLAAAGTDWNALTVITEAQGPASLNNGPVEGDLNWSRAPMSDERDLKYVVAYDRGGSYAASTGSLVLPAGRGQLLEGNFIAFDKARAGYWKYQMPDTVDWRMPNPFDPRQTQPKTHLWATTPQMDVAIRRLGYEPVITQAFIFEKSGRYMDDWYKRVRDARETLDTDDADDLGARQLIKHTYTDTIGMMGSATWREGKRGYLPAWRHTILGETRMRILVTIHDIGTRTGRWPVFVTTDTVGYLADTPDPVAAWPGAEAKLGRGMGQFKPEGIALTADHLHHLTGKGYKGKDDLLAPYSLMNTPTEA